jgi:uncharacterized coiled-coil DUF342 family protein
MIGGGNGHDVRENANSAMARADHSIEQIRALGDRALEIADQLESLMSRLGELLGERDGAS